MYVQIIDASFWVDFRFMKTLAVSVLLGTEFINKFIKGISLPGHKIVLYTSR